MGWLAESRAVFAQLNAAAPSPEADDWYCRFITIAERWDWHLTFRLGVAGDEAGEVHAVNLIDSISSMTPQPIRPLPRIAESFAEFPGQLERGDQCTEGGRRGMYW